MSRERPTLLCSAPELVEHEGCITIWRTCGTRGTPGEGLTVQEIATPACTRAMALITCDVTDCATRTARRSLGLHDAIATLSGWDKSICQHLTEHDIAPGEPATGEGLSSAQPEPTAGFVGETGP